MFKKKIYISWLCFVIAAVTLVSCSHASTNSNSANDSEPSKVLLKEEPANSLDGWIGDYEYLYPTAGQWFKDYVEKYPDYMEPDFPYLMKPKFVFYELSIYKEGEDYFGICAANGWLTGYEIKVKVEGNAEEISIIYDSIISGGVTWGSIPDFIFKLKKSDGKMITQWGFDLVEEEAFVRKEEPEN